MVDSRKHFRNSCGVADHAHCSHYLCKITTRHDSRRLVVDTTLETSWTPVDELNCTLGLDSSNSRVNVFGNYISAVHQTTGHVFAMTRVTLHHHGGWFKYRHGDFSD